ncbi:MAG: response regulator transcription factor [Dehalococcoidia bacterium]
MPEQSNLTAREHEVRRLLHQRYTNEDIARVLGVSVRTAEWHVANVLGKLGATKRNQIGKVVENR